MTKQELNRALGQVYENLNCVELQEVQTSKNKVDKNKHFYIVEMEEDYEGKILQEKERQERKNAYVFLLKVLGGLGFLAAIAQIV